MRDNDIIEKIHGLYDVKEPDVLSRLDFSKVEMQSAPEKSIKKRYFSAVAVYAAACLVVAIALPFIIGGGEEPVNPKPQPGVSVSDTETADTTNEFVESNEDILDEFMAALERAIADGRIEGEFDRSNCFEVTTRDVLSKTGARLFKFADTNYTFIYADGEAYETKNIPDGPGISGTVAWDYDENGKCDILLSVPQIKTGGVERTSVYVFNMDTKSMVPSRIVLQNWAAVTKAVGNSGETVYPICDVTYSIDANRKMLSVPKAGEVIYGYIDYDGVEIVLTRCEPGILDEFMAALERAIADGRIKQSEHLKRELIAELYPKEGAKNGIHVFLANNEAAYVYSDGEVYFVPVRLNNTYVYNGVQSDFESVQFFDIDENGKCDLLLYGVSGSGVPTYHMICFDADAKSFTTLCSIPFYFVKADAETGENGDVHYSLYVYRYRSNEENRRYIGELVYEKGELVMKLIREGTIEEVIKSIDFDEPAETEPPVSIDYYPIPVETTEPEVPTPDDPEPAETTTTSKKIDPVGTSTTKKPEPEPDKPAKVYDDPADHVRVRFFNDIEMTEEYASVADIPYGAKVYYEIKSDPGYICANFSINVYNSDFEVDLVWKENYAETHEYFINNYHGDKLECLWTGVLAGDADGNLTYDASDAETLRKYLEKDTTTLWNYGINGYSEKLDYDCNGVVNKDDLTGLLAEIENGDAERNVMSMFSYVNGAGTMSRLLELDQAAVLPHGRDTKYIESDFNVYYDYSYLTGFSSEIKEKYDESFFVSNDLIMIYCYTENGEIPTVDEVYEIWITGNNADSYLNIVYSGDNAGQILSEYVICIPVSGNLDVYDNVPR